MVQRDGNIWDGGGVVRCDHREDTGEGGYDRRKVVIRRDKAVRIDAATEETRPFERMRLFEDMHPLKRTWP